MCPAPLPNIPPLFWVGKGCTVHGTCGQVFLNATRKQECLVQQDPSYHEFITAIQHQLLGDIWRVPSMSVTVSGAPQGCILAPFKFLFALLGTKGASACKHGLFVQLTFPISRRAALLAVKSGRVHGLRYARACRGRPGMEAKAPGSGGGGRG